MIRHIVVDCDGVLSSGKQYVDHTGEKVVKDFHSRDIRAIRELVAQGIDVVVMSADDWKGTLAWCQRVGCRFLCTRDKHGILANGNYLPEETLVLGDDAWDVRAMQWATYKACPADAHESVLNLSGVMFLDIESGQGVVSALVDRLYKEGLL